MAGGFFARIGRVFGPRKQPYRPRKRRTADEKIKEQTATFLRNLQKENPPLYREIMTQRVMKELGYEPNGGDGPEPDPFDAMIAQAEKVKRFNDLINPSEPKSTLGEIREFVTDLAKTPAAAAVIGSAMRGSGATPFVPPSPPPTMAPPPLVTGPPAPPMPSSPPAPAAAPAGDVPDLPIDRFLPLLELSPEDAAAKLAEMADADEARGDNALWDQLEDIADQGADKIVWTLKVLSSAPLIPRHIKDTAQRLAANEPWLRALVAAIQAGMVDEDEAPPVKPVKSAKKPKAAQG